MKLFLTIVLVFKIFIIQNSFAAEIYVVLKVNNKIITNVDIDNEYRYLAALSPNLKNIEKKKIMKLARDSIIREKIKKGEIDKYFNLEEENKFIDRIIVKFYKGMGMQTVSEFKNYLIKNNLNFDEVREKIKIEAAWNDVIYKKFSKRIEIDEQQIKKELNKIISEKKELNVYNISEILFNAENYEQLQKKYQSIEKSILEIGFNNSANIYSLSESAKTGGEIGWINESQLNQIIKKEIINLNIKEYTKPITIPGGFLIIMLNDKKVQKVNINFKEEYDKRIAKEKNTQLSQFSEIYFKKIKKNSTISEK